MLLVASSAVGCEACLYPPGSGDSDIERLASRFDHDAVVADHAGELGKAVLITLDQLATDEGQIRNERRSAPVLILTTGTTGEQKGVPHDWTSLSQAARRISDGPDSRWLLAFNLNQFAGIQVLLHALVNGGTLVELQSRAPDDVILTIRRKRVTHASATPTLWRLVAGRLTPTEAQQLPLAQITLGGEAASEELLTRLGKLFPDARISHVYAGTEFGSVVSVRDGHAGLPLAVLERESEADTQLRIVNGELQVRSRVAYGRLLRSANSRFRVVPDRRSGRDQRRQDPFCRAKDGHHQCRRGQGPPFSGGGGGVFSRRRADSRGIWSR